MSFDLKTAQAIIAGALEKADSMGLKPLAVAVLDARGAIRAVVAQDGASAKRAEVALAKANGCVALGIGSREISKRPQQFLIGAAQIVGGHHIMPVPGGVLIRDRDGSVLGAVGISGDTSDNDEAAAVAGITGQGFEADPGQ